MNGGIPVTAMMLPLIAPASSSYAEPRHHRYPHRQVRQGGKHRPGEVRSLGQTGGNHRRQRQHRAGRQVDTGGDDHLGHADGQQADDRHLQDHQHQALGVHQETLVAHDPAEHFEHQADADQHQEDTQFRRQSPACPGRCGRGFVFQYRVHNHSPFYLD